MTEPADKKRKIDEASPPSSSTAATVPFKSYKKKYKRLELEFHAVMVRSRTLKRKNDRATRIFNRLQRQNDQLLDILMDINQSSHFPADHKLILADPAGPLSDQLTDQHLNDYLEMLSKASIYHDDDEKQVDLPHPMSASEWAKRVRLEVAENDNED